MGDLRDGNISEHAYFIRQPCAPPVQYSRRHPHPPGGGTTTPWQGFETLRLHTTSFVCAEPTPAPASLISVRYVQPENTLDDSVKSIPDTFCREISNLRKYAIFGKIRESFYLTISQIHSVQHAMSDSATVRKLDHYQNFQHESSPNPRFAKTKELQSHQQPNTQLQHICFCPDTRQHTNIRQALTQLHH